jgi:hypothetical protein
MLFWDTERLVGDLRAVTLSSLVLHKALVHVDP